jgi:hypothetical protein
VVDGRIKGKTAEREVVHILQNWWRKHEPDAEFVRTPMSGGWSHGTTAREGFRSAADIMTTSEIFPFSVEIKRREGWSFERLRDGKKSPVLGWWRQTRSEARDNKQVPMLWVRRSRMPWQVILPDAFVVACWEREREGTRKLPVLAWSYRPFPDALAFEAASILKYPPDYFIAAA